MHPVPHVQHLASCRIAILGRLAESLYLASLNSLMKKQEYLLELIKSMNANERRYFKLFSGVQPGEKRYLQLYEALESEERYDAEKLCKQLGIKPKQLTDDKQYLQQILLQCLRNFEEISSDTKAEQIIHIGREDAWVLMSRRLHAHALDIAEKTLVKAWEFERFELIADLLSIKWVCLYNMEQFEELTESNEQKKVAEILAELTELNTLRGRVVALERKRGDKSDFKKILQHPLLKMKPDKLLSLRAQIAWFETMIKCLIGGEFDYTKALEIGRLQWAHYDKHPTVKKVNPLVWILSYSYLANTELGAGNGLNALKVLEKMENLLSDPTMPLSKATLTALKAHVFVLRTEILFNLQRFKDVVSEVAKANAYIEQRPVYERIIVLFYHTLALLHLKQSESAVNSLEELLQLNTEQRLDIQTFLRPVQILAQLDMGNYQLVPYLVKSARAWMKRKKISSPEVELFLSFTYAIARAPEPRRREHWLKIQKALDAGEMKLLDKELNLKVWLESKLARN
ncbi:MAG: hypothetical protein JWO06_1119 [Bacteroidota bacterium]|nr:hypothetical protein [Bacteroidota bacterium]